MGHPCPGVKVYPPRRARCASCGRRAVNRPRRLCAACYADPLVRQQFPPVRDTRGGGKPRDGVAPRPLPRRPTDAPPGSEAKILVLIDRARRGLQLHHPDDAGAVGTL